MQTSRIAVRRPIPGSCEIHQQLAAITMRIPSRQGKHLKVWGNPYLWKMSSYLLLSILLGYFIVLMVIARLTKGEDNQTFLSQTDLLHGIWWLLEWLALPYLVFYLVPGWVEDTGFSYFQMVLGYIVSYFVIGTVLLPIYYNTNSLPSTPIYLRFGAKTYKTRASFLFCHESLVLTFACI